MELISEGPLPASPPRSTVRSQSKAAPAHMPEDTRFLRVSLASIRLAWEYLPISLPSPRSVSRTSLYFIASPSNEFCTTHYIRYLKVSAVDSRCVLRAGTDILDR